MSDKKLTLTDHLTQLAPAVLFLACSLLLLHRLGVSKAMESYPVLQMERLANLGADVERTMETFLRSGVSLHQFAGFRSISDPYLKADDMLHEIRVTDAEGRLLFVNTRARSGDESQSGAFLEGGVSPETASFASSQEGAYYQVTLPLDSKFETVGNLVLLMPKSLTRQAVQSYFSRQTLISIFLLVSFGLCLFILRITMGRKSIGLMLLVYVGFFVMAAWYAGGTLRGLYQEGVSARSQTLGESFAARLRQIGQLGLDLGDISEIDLEFERSEARYEDISQVAFVREGRILFHSSPDQAGEVWTDSPQHFQHKSRLNGSSNDFIVVALPQSLISERFGQELKKHLGFMAGLLALSLLLLWLVDYYLIVGFETLVIPAIFVMSLSFCLLFYVGLGEAWRGYPKLELEKLASQGETLQQTMDTFLKAGVPLNQFVGFNTASQSILAADPDIMEIKVLAVDGTMVFYNGGENPGHSKPSIGLENGSEDPSALLPGSGDRYHFSENEGTYQVTLPLSNKFEKVGDLTLVIPQSVVADKINQSFKTLALWMLVLIASFAAFVYVDDRWLPDVDYLHVAHGFIFFVAACLVVYTLTTIYSFGIQGKTRALSISVGTRLDTATEIGLPISVFSGIDQTFKDYKSSNPELDGVALMEDSQILIHTDQTRVGGSWAVNDDHFAYNTMLAPAPSESGKYQVSVSIPKKFVYGKLWRSIKNFLVLFIATALLASLFHTLMNALADQRKYAEGGVADHASVDEVNLVLIKILFFAVVFMEGLFSSFLPQYLQEISTSAGLDAGSASLLFTAYFAAFALSLVPSGGYADKHGVKLLMVLGVAFSSLSVYLLTRVVDFYMVMALRVLAGMGQGMIFIGVQSFILQVTSRGKTTQGTSIIVFSYNTGMISGTAIGALLVIYMGAEQVFLMGALIGLFILSFILFLVPDIRKEQTLEEKPPLLKAFRNYLANLRILLEDLQFIKTILLLGLTTKATLTGIIVYAMPLIMAGLAYQQDDIGQVLMFYAAGVLISNIFIPKIADRMGNTARILFWGALGSGVGLVTMGLIEQQFATASGIPYLSTILLIFGVSILGLAHGFIHAPIVTHIAYTRAARVLGKSTTTSIYRFLERIGHVMGPLVVGYFLVLNQYRATTLIYIGFAIAVFGVLFSVLKRNEASQVAGR